MEGAKPIVLVLMGGESDEHDISMRSGAAVARNLPEAGYEPVPVVVTRDGWFQFPPVDAVHARVEALRLGPAVERMTSLAPACVFIAMHGPYGEDGRMQSLCDLMHVPHVGADAIGSGVAMDKWLSKCVYRAEGLPTPEGLLLSRSDLADADLAGRVAGRLGLPVVVKAVRNGSSYGVTIARDAAALDEALRGALEADDRVLAEAFRRGRELTVPVLEDPATGEPRALPLIEIRVATHEFFDTEAKYDPTLSEEICPAPVPEDVAERARALGIAAHRALALSGFSRTDLIWDDAGLWILETNTIPGLTEQSLFPKSIQAEGRTFADLVRTLVQRAIARGRTL